MYDFDLRDEEVTVDGVIKPQNRYIIENGSKKLIAETWAKVSKIVKDSP
jgi:hypothetical protein